jgi:hypothetical protein
MYNPTRLEWHSGDESRCRTPQFAVVGLDKHQARLLPTFNRLVAALPGAKIHQNELRGFLLSGPDRTPHEVGAASGAARKETATRYAVRLGGSSRIIRAAGRIIKPRGIR